MTDTSGVTDAEVKRVVGELSRYDVLSGLVTDHQVRASLTAALAGRVVVPAAAINYARMMSNICFNMAQSDRVEPSLRKSMKECQLGFDAAMIAAAVDGGAK